MRKTIGAALAAAMLMTSVAATLPGSAVACADDDGRAHLTTDGFSHTFEAPAVAYPGLCSPANNHIGPETTLRSAPFSFTVDLAPAASAQVTIDLTWSAESDYDIFVFDDDTGAELGRSADPNIDGGTGWDESAWLTLEQCQRITVFVRSWAGSPAETLTLDIGVTPAEPTLACLEGDIAANCEGIEAGGTPSASTEDGRAILYLGATGPGQASMLYDYASSQAGVNDLPRSTLVADRPTSGTPDGHTRLLVGFHDRAKNPLVAHWTGAVDGRDIVGEAFAEVWISSRTADPTAVLYAYLFLDGSIAAEVAIPGDELTADPKRHVIRFAGLDATAVGEVTLQIAAEPFATSEGHEGNAADAEATIHFGSVQFPSRVTLP